MFAETGKNFFLSQSFSKNLGMYGQRVGCLHFGGSTPEETDRLFVAGKCISRIIWSWPSKHGVDIAKRVMQRHKEQWFKEVHMMFDRLELMRKALVKNLKKLGSKKDWSHITT